MEGSKLKDNLLGAQHLKLEENNLEFGFQLLSIFSLICGKWLSIFPMQVKRYSLSFWLFQIYSCIATVWNTFAFVLFIASWILLQNNGMQLEFAIHVYGICGLLIQMVCTSRSFILHFKKSKIETFIKKIQNYRSSHQSLKNNNSSINHNLNRFIVISLFVFFASYTLSIAINFNSIIEIMNSIKSGENVTSLEGRTFYHYVKGVDEVVPFYKDLFTSNNYCLVISYIICMLNLGVVVVTDVLFCSCYWVIVEELKNLTKSLGKYLEDEVKLQWWIQRHKKLSRLLREFNSITSPAITISVILNAFQICFAAFTVVKLFHQTIQSNHFISVAFIGINCLSQLLLYCCLGHKIREQVSELQNASYHAPWQRTSLETQLVSIMICSVSTERSLQLPGAPFFALTLDFFVSVIGAIFTYFIILIQMQ